MYRLEFLRHVFLLVVIHNLNIVRIAVAPHEADAPLIVDPNAVLAGAISAKAFESVSARDGQVAKLHCEVNLIKLPPGNALDGPELPYRVTLKELFSIRVTEGPDHGIIL